MTDYAAIAKTIRKESFLASQKAGIAHLASAFSIVEILIALYFGDVLNVDGGNPQQKDRDYFFLSKGHGALALYSTLYQKGFFDRKTLHSFSLKDSILGSEPDVNLVPGIEASTGSLGQGLSIACGAAMAAKLDRKTNKFFCLVGDGECQEGSIWEAMMFASGQRLGNLTLIIDRNALQKMGKISSVLESENWGEKCTAFGFETKEVDGHNVSELIEVFNAPTQSDAPKAIIANTVKGKGVKVMENKAMWHYKMPNDKDLPKFLQELDITQEEYMACKELL